MQKYKQKANSHEKYLKDVDDFCANTIRMMKRESICPKSARWLGAQEIVNITQKIHTEIHRANNIKVTNRQEKELRHALQINAYSLIQTLGEKFRFNSLIYDIDVDAMTKWLDNKAKTQSWISAWINSDEKRYKDIG